MRSCLLVAIFGTAASVRGLPAPQVSALDGRNGTAQLNSTHQQHSHDVVMVGAPQADCTLCLTQPSLCPNLGGSGSGSGSGPGSVSANQPPRPAGGSSNNRETVTVEYNRPIATLEPAVHWSYDTRPVTNVIPIPADKGSQMYYGVDDPTKSGHYAFLTYYFKKPSVNLDHSDHASVQYGSNGLTVTFTNREAFQHAADSWNPDGDMILVAFAQGCGDWAKGERCYFLASGFKVLKDEMTIVARGSPSDPNDIISKGDTEWGWWVPGQGVNRPDAGSSGAGSPPAGSPSGTAAGPPGPSFSWNPSSTADNTADNTAESTVDGPSSSGNPNSVTSGIPSAPTSTMSPDGNEAVDFSKPRQACQAPVDNENGLPSACLGQFFDLDLDADLGWEPLSQEYLEFVKDIAPSIEVVGESKFKRTAKRKLSRKLRKRGFFGDLWNAIDDYVIQPLKDVYQAVQEATTISGSFNNEISWKLPDPSSDDEDARSLKDPDAKQVESPWGDSILLKAFGEQEPEDEDKKFNAYMNIFCVGCGVSGNARVSGKASWTPLGGFTEGQLSINADVQFVLQIGIDAQMTYQQEFENTLLDVGLPGLEYGIVRIGPSISVGSRVTLEASAKGQLLAGAEMGLQNAEATIDFINPGSSSQQNFSPYFKPVFEAEGELMLSAELGLPLGIHCGVRVAGFSVDISLIDEPSIKGVAQVAASIGLNDDNQFEAGFSDTDGCTGISTVLSWRNRVYIDVFGLDEFTIYDTDDNPLARGCIALPGRPSGDDQSTTTQTEDPTGTTTSDPMDTQTETDTIDPTDSASDITDTQATMDTTDATATMDSTDIASTDSLNPTETEAPTDTVATDATNPTDAAETNTNPTQTSDDITMGDPTTTDGETTDDALETSGTVASQDSTESTVPTSTAIPVDEEEFFEPPGDGFPASRLRARQAIPDNTTSSTNATGRNVVDLTSKVKTNTSKDLSYEVQGFQNRQHVLSTGLETALLINPEITTMVVSCANGNIYAFKVEGDDNPLCSEMWTSKDDVLITDGAQRIMHYYNNTMSAVGVSRLRLEDETDIPSTAVVVAFVPYFEDENKDDYVYLAVDPNDGVFYPVVCDYADGSGSKVFLALDPDEGAEALQNPDLEYTITGGKVSKCYPMVLLQGEYVKEDDWLKYGNSNDKARKLDYEDDVEIVEEE
ncbi:hypothetical protein FDECE_3055 [Fusarium decemcellulare]|nr:hypothetical protein FDECE_3055 [Fusarium decemcellulare]